MSKICSKLSVFEEAVLFSVLTDLQEDWREFTQIFQDIALILKQSS